MTLDDERKVACLIRLTALMTRSEDAEGGLDEGEEAYIEKLWREVHGDGAVSSGVVVRGQRVPDAPKDESEGGSV